MADSTVSIIGQIFYREEKAQGVAWSIVWRHTPDDTLTITRVLSNL